MAIRVGLLLLSLMTVFIFYIMKNVFKGLIHGRKTALGQFRGMNTGMNIAYYCTMKNRSIRNV